MEKLSSHKYFTLNLTGLVGSLILLGFSCFSFFKWYSTGLIFYALLFLKDLLSSWYLVVRKNRQVQTKDYKKIIIAYISSSMPFIYLPQWADPYPIVSLLSTILAILGFSISTIALIELGSSFGVSPALRGHVQSGIYRFIRHPMYIGYGVSEFGFILLNPYNSFFYILSVMLYFLRSRMENEVLEKYSQNE